MTKREEARQRRLTIRRAAFCEEITRRDDIHASRFVIRATRPGLDHSLYPADLSEMATRIQREGEHTVPNRDRDVIAGKMPVGEFTRRDGTSVAPVLFDV